MKISDIAKQLGMSIREVREKASDLGFSVSSKSNTISDNKAKELVVSLEKAQKEKDSSGPINVTEGNTEDVKIEKILIPSVISVKNLSEKMSMPVTRVITELMKNGVMASINENIDFDTAAIVGDILGFEVEKEKDDTGLLGRNEGAMGEKIIRPPVVTIIGHVDHGKTTLLDRIREADVVSGEFGGITQHIGAYQVEKKGRKITFLDTPGHEAFSAMREHGVRITDIAILVVAADDGVKPQTKESIRFAKDAGVPVIVAINKIDKPDTDIERIRGELAELDLVDEKWGGKTIIVPISAKTGEGIDSLLEMILLVADMKDIEGYVGVPANGFVIESHLSASKGPLATVLIRDGILKVGDSVVIGKRVYGKIRLMTDYNGKKIKTADSSTPVRIAGLSGVPNFGELLEVESNMNDAKNKVLRFKKEQSYKGIGGSGLVGVSSAIRSGKAAELCLIIKADVAGSLRAIKDALDKLLFEEAKIRIVSEGVGEINETDVKMAVASGGTIIGFNVGMGHNAKRLLENNPVHVEMFSVIYELIDKIVLSLSGLLEPELKEVETGKGVILKIFKDSKKDKIVGVRIKSGVFEKNSIVKFTRAGQPIAEGRILSIRKVDKEVSDAGKGTECGLKVLFGSTDEEKVELQENDNVACFKKEEFNKELTKI